VIATLLLAFGIVGAVFLPLYFIQLRHFSPERMGVMMSAIGVASLVGFVTVPLLSDHFGRKPVVCFFGLLGACAPVASLYWMGSDVVLGMLLFLGNLLTALPALVIGTIPSESVLARGRGAVLGMVMGIAELLGGFMSPIGAGWLADRTSLAAPLFIQIVCALLIAVFATMLWETAPKKVRPAAFVAAKAL
jgi:sugar phosphate permease